MDDSLVVEDKKKALLQKSHKNKIAPNNTILDFFYNFNHVSNLKNNETGWMAKRRRYSGDNGKYTKSTMPVARLN